MGAQIVSILFAVGDWLKEHWADAVTVVALILSLRANRISQKAYIFSTKPIVDCYLATYKTGDGTPFIVLVVENYGSLTARNIDMVIEYPEGIDNLQFGEDFKRLGETKFTLAPHTKLSTPICLNADTKIIVDSGITIRGKFFYYDIDNKIHHEKMAHVTLTLEEFNLFNALNKAGG